MRNSEWQAELSRPNTLRVAIVHYWLVSMRGGEKVLEALAEMYPEADIFTLVVDRDRISESLKRHHIIPSFLQRLPGVVRYYPRLLPLMPIALEHFDLAGYDLVISSEAGPSKGVIVPPGVIHVCYCHSPMRYLWDQYHTYRRGSGALARVAMSVFSPSLRSWDVTTASRVDAFAASSHHVAQRIWRYYRREATVVSPFAEIGKFRADRPSDDFYLCVGQLAEYKRVDLVVDACTRLGRSLVVIGEGPMLSRLKTMAGPTVTLMDHQSSEVVKDHLERCRALIFPGEEDFGIVPLEAMACGRPVIAYGKGGVLDTVASEQYGELFADQSVECLVDAIGRFERREGQFDRQRLRQRAEQFTRRTFQSQMRALIAGAMDADTRHGSRVNARNSA